MSVAPHKVLRRCGAGVCVHALGSVSDSMCTSSVASHTLTDQYKPNLTDTFRGIKKKNVTIKINTRTEESVCIHKCQ